MEQCVPHNCVARRRDRLLRSIAVAALFAVLTACSPHGENRGGVADKAPTYSAQVINPALSGGLRVPASNALLVWGTDGSVLRSTDGSHWEYANTPILADLSGMAT